MVSRPQGLQTIKPYMIYSKHCLWFDLFKKHLRMMLLWFIIPDSVTTHFDKSSHEWMINIFPDIVTGKNLAIYLTVHFWFAISQNYEKYQTWAFSFQIHKDLATTLNIDNFVCNCPYVDSHFTGWLLLHLQINFKKGVWGTIFDFAFSSLHKQV